MSAELANGKERWLQGGENRDRRGNCCFFLSLITSSLSDMGDLEVTGTLHRGDPWHMKLILRAGGGDLALTGGNLGPDAASFLPFIFLKRIKVLC